MKARYWSVFAGQFPAVSLVPVDTLSSTLRPVQYTAGVHDITG